MAQLLSTVITDILLYFDGTFTPYEIQETLDAHGVIVDDIEETWLTDEEAYDLEECVERCLRGDPPPIPDGY